ncbi:MAG: hypothetical protein ABR540_08710 [Acidimicrobiales bacterium]
MSASDAAVRLHVEDYPKTLHLLAELLGRRSDRDRLGYWPDELGAMVDWEHLTNEAPLSSTEIATVRIARGCATLERGGGLPAHLGDVVADVVATTTRER